jgi:abelson tyrosine-protein kinase 1
VDFEVYTGQRDARVGETWGKFSTTTDLSTSIQGGPMYGHNEAVPLMLASSKVSTVCLPSEPWDTVLLARLRFLTDRDEPTSH